MPHKLNTTTAGAAEAAAKQHNKVVSLINFDGKKIWIGKYFIVRIAMD